MFPVFFIWFYILWWCFLIDATQYVYASEIWPNHLRSQGTALGVAFFYLASEVTLVAAPVALNDIGWRFYLVLICPSAVYITLMYFFFPVSATCKQSIVSNYAGERLIFASTNIGDQRPHSRRNRHFVWRRVSRGEPLVRHIRRGEAEDRRRRLEINEEWPNPRGAKAKTPRKRRKVQP